jgi:hypothetical protein
MIAGDWTLEIRHCVARRKVPLPPDVTDSHQSGFAQHPVTSFLTLYYASSALLLWERSAKTLTVSFYI